MVENFDSILAEQELRIFAAMVAMENLAMAFAKTGNIKVADELFDAAEIRNASTTISRAYGGELSETLQRSRVDAGETLVIAFNHFVRPVS